MRDIASYRADIKINGKRLSQSEIAKMIGISKTAYCNKETGNRDFNASEIKKFVDIYEKYTGQTLDLNNLSEIKN